MYKKYIYFTVLLISNNCASDKPHWLRYCYCAKLHSTFSAPILLTLM